jgi:phospholipid/cholesterol/gamma-HCH transport system substrate-binding protein
MGNRYKYILIGVLVSLTIAIFIFGLNYLKGKNYFIEEDTYYVVYERIEGLTVSSPVLINGYTIGQVRDIRFTNKGDGSLIVQFVVKKQFRIPQETVARIFSLDLMGTKAIELELTDKLTLHQSGDTLLAETEESLKEQVSIEMLPLKNKAEDLLIEMEEAIKIIRIIFNEQTRQNLIATIDELNETIIHLNSSASTIDTFLIEENKRISQLISNLESITGNLDKNRSKINSIIANIDQMSDSLSQIKFISTFKTLDSSLLAINTILQKIESGEGTLGMLIYEDSLYNALNQTSIQVARLAEDLRVNPKRYMHFSVFDLGRTMYVLDDNKMNKKAANASEVFHVLLYEDSAPVSLDSFEDIDDVTQKVFKDRYYYTVGAFKKLKKAQNFLEKVKSNYPNAKIVSFNKGELNRY